MRVALVSSAVGSQCGIGEHSAMLIQHVQAADPTIEISAKAEWLDPQAFADHAEPFDVVHLNYHRGLHSRWTPRWVSDCVRPVVITFHDTYEHQPDTLPWDLLACENVRAMVVHEPCDLHAEYELHLGGVVASSAHYGENRHKVRYWRQACPPPNGRGWDVRERATWAYDGWRPTLGTLGFDFPWKNYDTLAQVTGALGWNLHVVGKVDEPRMLELRSYNPRTTFAGWAPKSAATAHLSACDATAFLYTCANSGTSGAIRAGITAARPLIALRSCRQFRDLESLGSLPEICWVDALGDLAHALTHSVRDYSGPHGYNPGLIHLAHHDSWTRQGAHYAALYQEAARG